MATEKMRFFDIKDLFPTEQRVLRYLPFDPNLHAAKMLNKENQAPNLNGFITENMPDNSNAACNVVVQDIDNSIND